ncbi:MAG: TniQ family protein, partial [Pseudonocardia sp.]|nr:TniQ family protein [Pseudonocardia sp.]
MTVNLAGHVRIRDWVTAQPPAPLPRTVAPLPYEAIHHYLRRLANANHLTVAQLSNLIHVRRPPGHADRSFGEQTRERLAAAAGQPLDRITRLYWGPDPDDR